MESDKNKVVFIQSIGTTSEPLVDAMEKNMARGCITDVFLIYGSNIAGQKAAMFETTVKLKKIAEDKGAYVHDPAQLEEPENIEHCVSAIEKVFNKVTGLNPSKLIVDFTGGTKPMVGALCHVAFQSAPCALELYYTGGKRDENGRVKAADMKPVTSEKTIMNLYTRQIMKSLKNYNYAQALALCEVLPHSRLSTFVTSSVRGLWLWDNFRYWGS